MEEQAEISDADFRAAHQVRRQDARDAGSRELRVSEGDRVGV